MKTDDKQNPGTSEHRYRPGEGSSGIGGKHRSSYQQYGNYGMVKTDSEREEAVPPTQAHLRDRAYAPEDVNSPSAAPTGPQATEDRDTERFKEKD